MATKATKAQGMYVVNLVIEGVTPLQQSKEYTSNEAKGPNETHADYEKRTWMQRAHINENGNVFMPAGALKKAMIDAARYSGDQIPGQGKKTYTAKVSSGICVVSDIVTNKKEKDIEKRDVFAGMNNKRVWKSFPTVTGWTATTCLHVYDPILSPEVVTRILDTAGKFIGIGTWRPQNGGEYGRFKIVKFEVSDL